MSSFIEKQGIESTDAVLIKEMAAEISSNHRGLSPPPPLPVAAATIQPNHNEFMSTRDIATM
jgi:hypothetical protein